MIKAEPNKSEFPGKKKKAYSTPRLQRLGAMPAVTHGSGGATNGDGLSMKMP
jgi:hypothetical protein